MPEENYHSDPSPSLDPSSLDEAISPTEERLGGGGSGSAVGTMAAEGGRSFSELETALTAYGISVRGAAARLDGEMKRTAIGQLKGDVAEPHHVASFNINARSKGIPPSELQARLTRRNHPTTDAEVLEGSRVASSWQLKYGKTPKKTADYLSRLDDGVPRYTDRKLGPSDQIDRIKQEARRSELRNREIRPEVAESQAHTKANVKGALESQKHQVQSDGLSKAEAEDLARRAKKGDAIEYEASASRRDTLLRVQLKRATTVGFVAGCAGATVGEIVRLLQSSEPLSAEEFAETAAIIVISGIDGAARAATTTVAHRVVAQRLFTDGARRAVLRSNVVTIGTNVCYDLAKGIWKYANGEVTGDELLADTVGSTLLTAAGVGGGAAGAAAASAIGIGASVGTPLGLLGVVVGGAIGGTVAALGTSALVKNEQDHGRSRVRGDIERIRGELAETDGDDPLAGMLRYVEGVGEMEEYAFSFRHLIPGFGTLGVLSEYRARQQVLGEIERRLSNSSKAERARHEHAVSRLAQAHRQRCAYLEAAFRAQEKALTREAEDQRAEILLEIGEYLRGRTALARASAARFARTHQGYARAADRAGVREEQAAAVRAAVEEVTPVARQLGGDRSAVVALLDEVVAGVVTVGFTSPLESAERFFITSY